MEPVNRKQRRLAKAADKKKEVHVIVHGAPYTPDAAFTLAMQQQAAGHTAEAIAIYRQILTKAPDHVVTLNNLGILLDQADALDEAIALFRRAMALQPGLFQIYNNLGSALTTKGDLKEAEAMFRKALTLQPGNARSLYCIAHIHKYRAEDLADARQIEAVLAQPDVADRHMLLFALGKMYDDSNVYDKAFAAFSEANRLLHPRVTYDPVKTEQDFGEVIRVFNKDFLAQQFSFSSQSRQPVFVVGMPRSGTTLLANILSNHPQVQAVGELLVVIELTGELSRLTGAPYPEAANHMTPAIGTAMIAEYERVLHGAAPANTPHIVDKHPMNFIHLGLISMLFPKAPIIHCTRDPMDTCLSNFFQYFDETAYPYAFDLGTIGHFYGQYRRVMAHWHGALPAPMLDIAYEDIVADIETPVRKALEFLGLPWDERCLTPHTNQRIVRTASVSQVRQPVYKKSVERWRHYEPFLGPLKEALKEG